MATYDERLNVLGFGVPALVRENETSRLWCVPFQDASATDEDAYAFLCAWGVAQESYVSKYETWRVDASFEDAIEPLSVIKGARKLGDGRKFDAVGYFMVEVTGKNPNVVSLVVTPLEPKPVDEPN